MRKHLKSKHRIDIEVALSRIQATALQQLQQLYLRVEGSGQTNEIDRQVFQKHLDKAIINEALVSLIVVRNLSFSAVEWPEFHTLCQVLNPELHNFVCTSHSTIKVKIEQAFYTYKDIVRKKLQSALTRIHLSIDIWTSPNRLLLVAVTGDFVDCIEEKHIKALLALRPVAGHSGEAQFDILLLIIQDFGIVRKLGAVQADNSSTNDTLC